MIILSLSQWLRWVDISKEFKNNSGRIKVYFGSSHIVDIDDNVIDCVLYRVLYENGDVD